mmetsp:Transcript_79633/g.225426  ORF Transcript_79633/g.225426 Transcript_79633/m.225426 type:complete len:203 (-) Transcript_79633:931-1539(-)
MARKNDTWSCGAGLPDLTSWSRETCAGDSSTGSGHRNGSPSGPPILRAGMAPSCSRSRSTALKSRSSRGNGGALVCSGIEKFLISNGIGCPGDSWACRAWNTTLSAATRWRNRPSWSTTSRAPEACCHTATPDTASFSCVTFTRWHTALPASGLISLGILMVSFLVPFTHLRVNVPSPFSRSTLARHHVPSWQCASTVLPTL